MILVTGGLGYIGSHTCIELLNEGYEVVIIDNLINSNIGVLNRIKELTGKNVAFYEGNLANQVLVEKIFSINDIDCCIHFAGLKSVGESVKEPLMYYDNNIVGTLVLLKAMEQADVKNIIFSSSATVYCESKVLPIRETFPKGECTNPYGWTKFMLEQVLIDVYKADTKWNIILLRYFNPIGAHKSGLIGEDPNGVPNNLLPYITQVAAGKLKNLNVWGNDYDTPDGTGVRDYIHVVDLAKGHVKAIKRIKDNKGLDIYNLGTGKGNSVLEVIKAFEEATGIDIPYMIRERRDGDIGSCYCDPSKAEKELDWVAKYNLNEMCKDAWNWQKKNPDGYR